jgi:disulfide bond formation protein DsbB
MPENLGSNLTSHYLQVQALTPSSGVSTSTPYAAGDTLALPLNLSLTQAAIFFVLLFIGALGLLFAQARRGTTLFALITLAFITSALPISMYIINRQTGVSSQAVSLATPKNLVVDQVTSTAFTVKWETDSPETGVLRFRQTPENSPLNRIISEPEGSDIYTHNLNPRDLTPNTTYYFEILSHGIWYDNTGQPLTVKTLP